VKYCGREKTYPNILTDLYVLSHTKYDIFMTHKIIFLSILIFRSSD
jgi:hypothetical protein